MKRRELLGAAAGLGVIGPRSLDAATSKRKPGNRNALKAGFAKVNISPPLGTTMMGFTSRDMKQGCTGIHDDIHTRALFLEHAGEQVLIMSFDLCFLGRLEADRFKGAIGRRIDLEPRQILLNTSHNHVAPSVGTWTSAGFQMPDRLYLNELEAATVRAAGMARESMREVTMWAGTTRCDLPLSRRKVDENGKAQWAPSPEGITYDKLPICLFKDLSGRPVCLLFSVSTHPSMIHGWEISAEYPGAAMDQLDKHFCAAASLFLQGVGGDAKPRMIGQGPKWTHGTWEQMDEAGRMISQPAIQAIESNLTTIEPEIRSATVETAWPLQPPPSRAELQAIVAEAASKEKSKRGKFDVKPMWAQRQLDILDRGGKLPTAAIITAQGIQLGQGLRIFTLEGEPVAEWGHFIEKFYGNGVTFPLGYSNGQGLYLPVSRQLPEGGYEVESAWEYGYPSNLAAGMEDAVRKAMEQLRERGIG